MLGHFSKPNIEETSMKIALAIALSASTLFATNAALAHNHHNTLRCSGIDITLWKAPTSSSRIQYDLCGHRHYINQTAKKNISRHCQSGKWSLVTAQFKRICRN
jgi:hypothetical protein